MMAVVLLPRRIPLAWPLLIAWHLIGNVLDLRLQRKNAGGAFLKFLALIYKGNSNGPKFKDAHLFQKTKL